ncbi:sugar phosphate nucleotidyltransferase [Candidatus Pelagibacter sp.]|nr:sugar phosphate nucleotidyltransferase [Candidatus Pelagibacter sp.]
MKFLAYNNISISEALKKIGKSGTKYLIIVNNNNKLLGTLADGDLRRAILQNKRLTDSIKEIYNKDPYFFVEGTFTEKYLANFLLEKKINFVPIIDKKKIVKEVISLTDLLQTNKKKIKKIRLPVVIMAGGKGTRLQPFTKVLPKCMIPINGKTVIEHIIESFLKSDSKDFYVTVNYKSKILKSFFDELNPNYKVSFVQEIKPLGTAGSLYKLKNRIKTPFFLTNSDIILNIDLNDLYNFHKKNSNDITMVVAAKEFKVPYGVCELNKKGDLKKITEKPKFNFFTNTGLYLVNNNIINLLENKKIDMDELIEKAKKNKKKIKVFPISDSQWFDIGQWNEYKKTVQHFKLT